MTALQVEDPVEATDWPALAAEVAVPAGVFVAGAPREAAGTRPVRSARDGSLLTELAWADEHDADQAVAAARQAFDHGPWPRLHPRERGEILQRFAALVDAHRAELALLVSLEMGKPIRQAHDIELRALVRTLRFYGELADKDHGEVAPTAEGELALVTREPAGVVAAVVPWNFPLTLAGWKFAPALAAGCAVVLKTAERSPLSMQRVAALGVEAGLPPGVLNVLSGDGAVVGRRLGEHSGVDVLTFTGSTEVGRHFLRYAADSNLKRVYLELGGKSPNIVLPDAPGLDAAADTAAWAIFFNSGQMCTAGSRLVVHRDVADRVLDRVLATASGWFPADPLLPDTKMGPLVDAAHLDRVRTAVRRGVEQGARLVTGGEQVLAETGGSYLEPTVLTGCAPGNPVLREEIFGPVLAVQVVDGEEEAIRVAGDTPYGLAAALWTADLGAAHRISRRLRAGTVWVNCYEEGDLSVPFGGVKLSGFGRDKSRHALDEYRDLKTTWIHHG
ncbi:aldehyde dehydrogenase family protein [Amycolatopsis sp.]|uniref:aldehyde dehydrogenase family protein n=1 Tax=Amycolatopsis sp. TaxID=37632 RepID=UPI002D7FAF88|nr:aldehyde dehydrogenase family protein [Amycolatopsis sp.]HET6708549.1 aldehyde dehydrogenase family protein [Amycolatopsis sp.]